MRTWAALQRQSRVSQYLYPAENLCLTRLSVSKVHCRCRCMGYEQEESEVLILSRTHLATTASTGLNSPASVDMI